MISAYPLKAFIVTKLAGCSADSCMSSIFFETMSIWYVFVAGRDEWNT